MKYFHTVALDPPWPETGGGKSKRGADRHYPVLKVRAIPQVIILDKEGLFLRVADNAHMYLWVTNNHAEAGMWVMGQLGFRYVTMITWVKPHAGLGQYFHGQTEHMLFGVRGDGYAIRRPTPGEQLTTVFEAPTTEHSAKPKEAYDLIERRSHGPYLELFARDPRPGWTVWGNQVLNN